MSFFKRHFYAISFATLAVCIAVFGTLLLFGPDVRTLSAYASEILDRCSDAPHRSTCYNETVPEYYAEIGFETMFELIARVQSADPAYGYCHLTAHRVAEYEVQRDPAKWMDTFVRCPQNGMCANGCMHGALITRFIGAEAGMTDEEIDAAVAELTDVCEPRPGWSPSGLDKGNCYHGLGHLAMYMTLGDIQGSLALCDRLGKESKSGDMSELCYGGVFMQLFQPLEPEDEAMVAHVDVSRDNFAEFCNSFPRDGGRISCFARGSMLFPDATTYGPAMKEFCEQSDDDEIVAACYDMVFALVGSGTDYNNSEIDRICRTVEPDRRGHCYGMAAINMIDADPSFIPRMAELCSLPETEEDRSSCFSRVAAYAPYRFNAGTSERAALCAALPESLQVRCTSSR